MGDAAVPRIATVLAALSLGVVVGAVLGLTGAGGGILAVPALVVGLGWSMQQAAPVALIAVAGGAAVGAIEGFRRRLVRYRAAILMAATGIPVTFIGILARAFRFAARPPGCLRRCDARRRGSSAMAIVLALIRIGAVGPCRRPRGPRDRPLGLERIHGTLADGCRRADRLHDRLARGSAAVS